MKKIGYKLIVGAVFALFVVLSKILFSEANTPVSAQLVTKAFWGNFMLFFAIGYVLLGNLLWMRNQPKK